MVIELNLVYVRKLFMFSHCLKFCQIIHDATASLYQQPASTRKKGILGFWLIACCKLALALAREIWRHNYVIGRNQYLISTLSAINQFNSFFNYRNVKTHFHMRKTQSSKIYVKSVNTYHNITF